MSQTFYIFETYVPQVYKFGYTTRDLKQQMKDYVGVSKPKSIVLSFKTTNGTLMEAFFKCYMHSSGLKSDTRFGREYFVCESRTVESLFE